MDRRPAGSKVLMALPMCRRDIADHLGLTLENRLTRTFFRTSQEGYLRFLGQTSARLSFLNSAGLAELDR